MTAPTDAAAAPAPSATAAAELLLALDTHASYDRVAILTDDGPTRYATFRTAVLGAADAATALGIDRGELIGLIGPRTVENVAAFLGLLAAGACPCFIDNRVEDENLLTQLAAVGMRRLIVDDAERRSRLHEHDGLVAHGYSDLRGDPNDCEPQVSGGDRAMMLFTSGSTGRPKGVLLSHENLMTNARGIIERTALTSSERLLHLMPFHHTNGVNNQILAPLIAGATIALAPRFSPKDAVARMRSWAPTYVTGVPTMFLRMLEHLEPGERFEGLKFLRCGSAPITTTQQERIRDAFGVPVILSYGMSEATCTSTMSPLGDPRDGTVGTVLAGQRVEVVVPGSTDPVPSGNDGEVLIGGSAVMLGYLGSDAPAPIDNGWLRTGDLGRVDSDGYLSITGRIKDTIIRGGENITPATVEHELMRHPAVTDCCVVGRPHDDLGEVPVAFVSITPGADEPREEELRSSVESALGRSHVPQRVVVLTALPTNSVGKLDRPQLRKNAVDLSV